MRKKDDTLTVRDIQPINLLNGLYKIITKVLVDRLAKFLPWLIDKVQPAFVKGRNIIKNFPCTQMVINCRRSCKIGVLCKLDFIFDGLN